LFCPICNKNIPGSNNIKLTTPKSKIIRHILSEHPGTRVKIVRQKGDKVDFVYIPKGVKLPQEEEKDLLSFEFIIDFFSEKKEKEKKEKESQRKREMPRAKDLGKERRERE
jgi:hypothetical protein